MENLTNHRVRGQDGDIGDWRSKCCIVRKLGEILMIEERNIRTKAGLEKVLKSLCKIEEAASCGRVLNDSTIEVEVFDSKRIIRKYYVPVSLVKDWNDFFRKKILLCDHNPPYSPRKKDIHGKKINYDI